MFKSQIGGLAPQGVKMKSRPKFTPKVDQSTHFQTQYLSPVPTRYYSTPKGSKFWGRGPLTPKNFGVPKRDFFIVRCKKMKIEKKVFGGVGAPPPPSLLPQN